MDAKALNIGPVSKDLLYSKIVNAIHSYVRANGLKAGDKLPSEREMAEVFQTGRNSVREALRVLENQGLVEVRTGRGAFLKERLDDDDSISIELVKNDFREIQELTQVLEAACLCRAIARGTPAQKQQLLLLAQQMLDELVHGGFNEDADHAFHIRLAEMSGNAAMAQLVRKLREEVFGQYWSCLDFDTSLRLQTVANHMELARAVMENDEPRALSELNIISRHTLLTMDLAGKPQ